MSKKPKDTGDTGPDTEPGDDLAEQAKVQKAFEAEALAEPAADAVEPYEGMPQRFLTGGATAAEKEAWVAENGGVDPTQPEGVVAPGEAEPKAEPEVPPTE